MIHPPGTHFKYACINLVILGLILEQITGKTLDVQLEENLTRPLGLERFGYGPIADTTDVVATRPELCGAIADPPARQIGFPVGNAGIFASADHLGRIATHLLARWHGKPSLLQLSQEAIQWMIQPIVMENVVDRAVCWDRHSISSVNDRPLWMSDQAVGHGGWTGHSLWIDPLLDRWVVMMTNRTLVQRFYEELDFLNQATRRARGVIMDLLAPSMAQGER